MGIRGSSRCSCCYARITVGQGIGSAGRLRRAPPSEAFAAVEPVAQHPHVSLVGPIEDVERIPCNWNCSDEAVHSDIAEHPEYDVPRRSQLAGFVHDEKRDRSGDQISYAGMSPTSASKPKRTLVP